MNFEAMKEDLYQAMKEYDAQFRRDHADCLDFGTCGFATVRIEFGRKRKIKEAFKEAGILGMEWSDSPKSYTIEIPRSTVPTQAIEYYENRAKAAADVINKHLEGEGVEAYTYSWVD